MKDKAKRQPRSDRAKLRSNKPRVRGSKLNTRSDKLLARSDRPSRSRRSICPLSCALDIWGDKWTLVVVRDLLFGKSRYNAFLDSAEGIPTNILADRLKRLEEDGLVEKRPYQKRPPRFEYCLTAAGKDLAPVLREIASWSNKHLSGTRPIRFSR